MAFENIHNYYERLVFAQVRSETNKQKLSVSNDLLEDIACVALNRLPARYIRHDIDLAFYLTSEERAQQEVDIARAVHYAIDFVVARMQSKDAT